MAIDDIVTVSIGTPPVVIDWRTLPADTRELVLATARRHRDEHMTDWEQLRCAGWPAPVRPETFDRVRARAYAWLAAVAWLEAADEERAMVERITAERDGLARALQSQCGEHAANCCAKWCAQCKAGNEALVAIGYKAAF